MEFSEKGGGGKEKKKKKKILLNSWLIKMSKGWVPWQLLRVSKQSLKFLQPSCGEFAGACWAPCSWEDPIAQLQDSPEKLL